MGKAFQGVDRERLFIRQRLTLSGQPYDPSLKSVILTLQFDMRLGQAMDLISRQAPQLAATG
jgi:hypothetical protein